LVNFISVYGKPGGYKEFSITIDRNDLSHSQFSDLKTLSKIHGGAGFTVKIANVHQEAANQALDYSNRKDLEQRFASYWISYPDFGIFINGNQLEFTSLIKN